MLTLATLLLFPLHLLFILLVLGLLVFGYLLYFAYTHHESAVDAANQLKNDADVAADDALEQADADATKVKTTVTADVQKLDTYTLDKLHQLEAIGTLATGTTQKFVDTHITGLQSDILNKSVIAGTAPTTPAAL